MSRYWSPLVSQLSPYVPGEQPGQARFIKLNTNELPWGPSARVLQALHGASDDNLRLYPDPESRALRQAFARVYSLSEQQVFIGNGSDEVLAHSFQALVQPQAPLLFPDLTYSFYPVYCALYQLPFATVPLDQDFRINVADYRRGNGGIIFANPNAPTGIALPVADIKTLLQANTDSVVIVDEAYVDFGGESAVSLVNEFPNLLVIQTLSKSRGLAGLRVGVAFGDHALIEGLQRVKNSFNSYPLDRLAEAGAVAALDDQQWFEDSCARLVANRQLLTAGLAQQGFAVLPSAANFVLARHSRHQAKDLQLALRERGILVRHFTHPRIEQYMRISVGTAEECEALLEALRGIIGPT